HHSAPPVLFVSGFADAPQGATLVFDEVRVSWLATLALFFLFGRSIASNTSIAIIFLPVVSELRQGVWGHFCYQSANGVEHVKLHPCGRKLSLSFLDFGFC